MRCIFVLHKHFLLPNIDWKKIKQTDRLKNKPALWVPDLDLQGKESDDHYTRKWSGSMIK
jgi:hypothetical protein